MYVGSEINCELEKKRNQIFFVRGRINFRRGGGGLDLPHPFILWHCTKKNYWGLGEETLIMASTPYAHIRAFFITGSEIYTISI